MNKMNCFQKASSLVLLAFFFSLHGTFAQIPKLLLKFAEKQNRIQSGYVKLQRLDTFDNDTTINDIQEAFFISTSKDFKYLVYSQFPYSQSPDVSETYCKSAHTLATIRTWKDSDNTSYMYDDKIYNAKDGEHLSYPNANGISVAGWKNHIFQRIPPKMDKKNIRYKIVYPDQDILSNISRELEFDRKTFHCIQDEHSLTYAETLPMYSKIDILEQRLYDYIHPDILDTISFMFETIKKGYDRQFAEKQAKKDSVFHAHLCDSIVQSMTKNGYKWTNNISQDIQQDTLFFMPEWKFSLLSGDTIYSDRINSRFLLIDMWYIACPPCMKAMVELVSIGTLYDESLLKMVSLNVSDKDTAKISQVVSNLNLKCDVALAYDGRYDIEMSKKMGNCQGYPQLYLVDMKTKQVIWHSCGWYAGFTKDIEEIIKAY